MRLGQNIGVGDWAVYTTRLGLNIGVGVRVWAVYTMRLGQNIGVGVWTVCTQ